MLNFNSKSKFVEIYWISHKKSMLENIKINLIACIVKTYLAHTLLKLDFYVFY